MENRYSSYSQGSSRGWTCTSLKNQELHEADVWEVLKDSDCTASPSFIPKRLPSAPKMMPNSVAQSAPLTIPDWSKIYGTSSKKSSSSWLGPDDAGLRRGGNNSWESEEDGHVIPPHEWVARRQISSFSVCEGAGRTLKGRDLSRVRNAVLYKTGFLEPKSDYL